MSVPNGPIECFHRSVGKIEAVDGITVLDVTSSPSVTPKLMARSNAVLLIKSLFLLKVVPEVIDPVMGPFQLGCIKRQIRTIEATNIRMMNLLLVIHPSIGRLQTRNVGRQTTDIIVGWNYCLGIIFPDNCIDLSAREY